MSDTNNNFEDLKKLLKLKRHEIPPPGYFNHFSGDVISRIRAGESGGHGTVLERLQSDSPFLATLLNLFHAKPGIIGGLATSVCLLLLIAVIVADRTDTASPEMTTTAMNQPMQAASDTASQPAPATAQLVAADTGGITVSSNPVVSLQPSATLFGAQQNPLFQPVAFMPAKQ